MPMTVEARLGIGAIPTAPVFVPGGSVFYRASASDLRKASFPSASDALFANTLVVSGGGQQLLIATYALGYYVAGQGCNGGFGDPSINFVHLTTGAVTPVTMYDALIGSVTSPSIGVILDGANSRACTINSTGGNPDFCWSRFPPFHGRVKDGSSTDSGNAVASFGNYNGGKRLLTFKAPIAPMAEAYFTTRPPANSALYPAMVPPLISGIYTLNYFPGGSGLPWEALEYGAYYYMFARASSLGSDYPAVLRVNKATGAFDVQILDAVNAAINGNFAMSFRIDPDFGRIYWSFSNLGFRVFGASLAVWPLSGITSVDVDTPAGANCVMGLYTEPPYVYAVKRAGGTFGNQYIRIFDTDLVKSARSRHRGSELWDMVPEVAPYISP